MPVNSFDDYPLTWTPDKKTLTYPYYASIAMQMERDIASGALQNRVKLPPQRELADYLDMSLSTVTKAYKLCERKGLISGRTGSGTYVCAGIKHSVLDDKAEGGCIQMGTILPLYVHNARVAQIAAELMSRNTGEDLFVYDSDILRQKHLRAGQKWLSHFGVNADTKHILATAGAQNALTITLGALFSSGDRIAVDRFTYANFIGLANMLGIRLLPVDGDEQGMLPTALDTLCRNNSVQGVYVMPSCSNPTNAVMGLERRVALTDVMRRHELLLIEDDIYAFLLKKCPTPLCTLYPERAVYINSLSKSVCAGLRTAYMYASPALCETLENVAYNCNLKYAALNLAIATELIQRDVHLEIMEDKRRLSLLRNACFESYFPEAVSTQNPTAYFQWLPLPASLRGADMEIQAASRHVRILDGARFAADGSGAEHNVRIAICSPKSIAELERGLQVLRSIYDAYEAAEISADIRAI